VFHWIALYPITTFRRSEFQKRELFLQFECLFKEIIKRTRSKNNKKKVKLWIVSNLVGGSELEK